MFLDDMEYITLRHRRNWIDIRVYDGAKLKKVLRALGARRDPALTVREGTISYSLLDGEHMIVRQYAGGEISVDAFRESEAVGKRQLTAEQALNALNGKK